MPEIRISKSTLDGLKKIGLADTQIASLQEVLKPKRLPLDTPLKSMGFDPDDIKKLPASVQKLNKEDLMSLGRWNGADGRLTAAAKKVSVSDVQLIRDVLGGGARRPNGGMLGPTTLAWDIYCCCCPCCCAAAVPDSNKTVKLRSFVVS